MLQYRLTNSNGQLFETLNKSLNYHTLLKQGAWAIESKELDLNSNPLPNISMTSYSFDLPQTQVLQM